MRQGSRRTTCGSEQLGVAPRDFFRCFNPRRRTEQSRWPKNRATSGGKDPNFFVLSRLPMRRLDNSLKLRSRQQAAALANMQGKPELAIVSRRHCSLSRDRFHFGKSPENISLRA